jgi:HSP20 family protein
MVYGSVKTTVIFLPAAGANREVNWAPHADIYHSRCGWLIKLDLAGVRQSDVTIEASGASLVVSGIRRDLMVNDEWSHYSMEIAYSRFERTIELPCKLDRARIEAELRDGMLLIHVMPEGEGR